MELSLNVHLLGFKEFPGKGASTKLVSPGSFGLCHWLAAENLVVIRSYCTVIYSYYTVIYDYFAVIYNYYIVLFYRQDS